MKLLCYFFCLLAAVSAAASQAPTEAMPEGFAGEWDVYIVNRKEKNLLADYHCRIQPDGTAELITPGSAGKQVWGRIVYHDKKLTLLLPEQENENGKEAQAEKRGLIADSSSGDAIEFRNDFQPDLVFRLERRRNGNGLTPDWLTGSWSLIQKNLKSGEERVAPFHLVFSEDGSYSFTGKDAERLNAEYAGSFEVKNNRLFLKNQCKEEDSLWFRSVFFRDGDRLVLNRLDVFVRAEKLPASSRQ